MQCLGVSNWYLLGAMSGRERKASRCLEDQGIETYLPEDTSGPVFPGYLFAKLTDLDAVRRSTYCWLPDFHLVPAQMMDEIRKAVWRRSDQCAPGCKVRLNDRAKSLEGVEAIVNARKGDRIVLLVEMMGRQQKVVVSEKAVEAA